VVEAAVMFALRHSLRGGTGTHILGWDRLYWKEPGDYCVKKSKDKAIHETK
jgi:hypothetical protein